MPTELLSSGVPTSVLQNTVYALPAGASAIESTVGLEISDNGTTWAALTKSASAKRFVRCASGNAIILVRSLSKAIQEYEVIGAPALTYQDTIKADGAVAYWPLDDPSGTTALDKVGTRHGTISGGVTLNQAGVNGSKCMDFNGTTGFIDVPALPNVAPIFSIEAWIKTRTYPGDIARHFGNCMSGIQHALTLIQEGAIQFGGYKEGGNYYDLRCVATPLENQAWVHVVVTMNSNIKIIYTNGIESNRNTDDAIALTTAGPWRIGGYTTAPGATHKHWNGPLQDVAFYNRALTPAEISSHYTKRLEGAPFSGLVSTDQLVSLWDFDSDFNDKVGTNHLTNVNGVTRVPGKLGNAASFNGVNQSLSCPSNTGLQSGGSSFTFACWAKFASFSGFVLGKDDAGANREYQIGSGTDRINFVTNGTNAVTTFLTVNLGVWYFIVGGYDIATGIQFVQVNNAAPTEVVTGAPVSANAPFTVGSLSGAYYGNCIVDQVLLFKRILSAAERTAMWNSGNGLRY